MNLLNPGPTAFFAQMFHEGAVPMQDKDLPE
jgi:hypothetical protein